MRKTASLSFFLVYFFLFAALAMSYRLKGVLGRKENKEGKKKTSKPLKYFFLDEPADATALAFVGTLFVTAPFLLDSTEYQ